MSRTASQTNRKTRLASLWLVTPPLIYAWLTPRYALETSAALQVGRSEPLTPSTPFTSITSPAIAQRDQNIVKVSHQVLLYTEKEAQIASSHKPPMLTPVNPRPHAIVPLQPSGRGQEIYTIAITLQRVITFVFGLYVGKLSDAKGRKMLMVGATFGYFLCGLLNTIGWFSKMSGLYIVSCLVIVRLTAAFLSSALRSRYLLLLQVVHPERSSKLL